MRADQAPEVRPVPDPTSLTTDQLQREIGMLKEQTQRELEALKELVFMRLDGMDKASGLLAEGVNKVPSNVSTQVGHLREMVFSRFDERDKAKAQAERDSKEALNNALGSLNARFSASDQTFTSLDERVRMLMPRSESEALHKAHEGRINAALARVNAIEERGTGARQNWGTILSVLSAATAVIAVLGFIMSKG